MLLPPRPPFCAGTCECVPVDKVCVSWLRSAKRSVAGDQIQICKPGEIQVPFKHLVPFLGKKHFPRSDCFGQEILHFQSK